MQDIAANFTTLDSLFLGFFPALIDHVQQHGPECGTPSGLITL
jgi:acyl carrier protein phosphodiesterase